jgi:hypothetical protein
MTRRERRKRNEKIIRKTQDGFAHQLFQNIKTNYSQLRKLLTEVNSHWCYEDYIYRFYHSSFKVYHLQYETRKIVEAL